MSGRYAFSLPEPRERDGWFKLGSIDVTTTVLVVGLGLVSMVLYAIDPNITFKGAFSPELVRDGEVWRLITWPLTNPPLSVWDLLGLVVFWFFGHRVEDDLGRKPFAVLLAAMAVIPAGVVTLLNIANEVGLGRWSVVSFSVSLFSLALLAIFGIEHPNAQFFFGIPAWVIAAAFVFIEVLRDMGDRRWAQLILALLVIAIGCIGARQRGMLEQLTFIPRVSALSGPARSPYGQIASTPRPRTNPFKRGAGRSRPKGGAGAVVEGPWGQFEGPTLLEQAELDVLLDKISDSGIDSLTPQEKERLTFLSKRMRGS